MRRKITLLVLSGLLMAFIPRFTMRAAEDYAYKSAQAVAFAKEHIAQELAGNSECSLVCDQFVKACLSAAGVEIRAGGVEAVKQALIDAGFGMEYKLKVSSDGVHISKADNPDIKAGDVIFIYCEECAKYLHTALISGFDADGNMLAYGHNPIWNEIDWFGNMTHTTDSGIKHSKCYQFYAVSMDTTPTMHQHIFTPAEVNLYEETHPHRMYAKCDCGAKYYLGWNATVSSCTICHPVTSEVPVLTAEYRETEHKVVVNWTPVENVTKYELYRAKSQSGKYFLISTTKGVKINNTSVEDGRTYYYKVKAVRETDTESVWSEIVSVAVGNMAQTPDDKLKTPTISGYIRTDNGKPRITWKAVDGAEKYEIYRSADGKTYQKTYTTKYASYTNTSAKAGNIYYYKVKAICGDKSSDYSNAVSFTLDMQAPMISGYIRTDNGKPRITWKTVDGAQKYEIYRSEDGVKYVRVYTTQYKSYSNTGAKTGKTYYYKVKAISGTKESSFSNTISLTVK